MRSIQESVLLMQHMADHLKVTKRADTAEVFLQKAREAQQRADHSQQIVINREKVSQEKIKEEDEVA